jgi:hypothetical protein
MRLIENCVHKILFTANLVFVGVARKNQMVPTIVFFGPSGQSLRASVTITAG